MVRLLPLGREHQRRVITTSESLDQIRPHGLIRFSCFSLYNLRRTSWQPTEA